MLVVSELQYRYGGRIPTALVTIGSNVSALHRLLDRLRRHLIAESRGEVVFLESGDAPNLKTVLRNIIRTTVTSSEGNESYQKIFTDRAVRSFFT
jgi:origin recognition complex subunit 3